MAAGEPIFAARTPRLLLRPLQAGDRAEFVRVRTESWPTHLAPWWPLPPAGQTPEQAFEVDLARAREVHGAGTGLRLAAFLLGTDPPRLAGLFNLNNLVRGVFLSADAGWSLAADAVGRGYGTEAVGAVLDLAFAPPPAGLGLHRVQANIMPANARSLALADRCGFRREGVAKAMLKIAGRWEDHITFAKLADEHAPTGAVLGAEALR